MGQLYLVLRTGSEAWCRLSQLSRGLEELVHDYHEISEPSRGNSHANLQDYEC